jgi:hypothetical protein
MLDQLLSDPGKIGATLLLLLGIAAFYKVLILPRQTHVEAIAQIHTFYKDIIAKRDEDIKREREENVRLRGMVDRNVDVVDKSLTALQAAQLAFEKAHEFRSVTFQRDKPGE